MLQERQPGGVDVHVAKREDEPAVYQAFESGLPLRDLKAITQERRRVMLNYQTNAYHDAAAIREVLNLRPIREFERWLEKMGILENGRLTARAGDPTIFAGKR